ncbi:hypothetical protein PCE1_000703 [Barthelona sp. PCE]
MNDYEDTLKQDHSVRVFGFDGEKVTEALLHELFLQVGHVERCNVVKNHLTNEQKNIAFVQFASEEEAEYATNVMNGVHLFGKRVRVSRLSGNKKKTVEFGAKIVISNLTNETTIPYLLQLCGNFGDVLDIEFEESEQETEGKSALVIMKTFVDADAVIDELNNGYINNTIVTVRYAFKNDQTQYGTANDRYMNKIITQT